MKHHLHFDCKV